MADGSGAGRDEEAVRRFIERFALDLSEAGMARMPARVFAAILSAEDGRCTAAELAELLGVSPAAVSGAVRYLLQVQLVSREREPGERRDHYRTSTDSWYEAMAQARRHPGPLGAGPGGGHQGGRPGHAGRRPPGGDPPVLRLPGEELARVLHDWRDQRTADRPGHRGA